MHQNWRIINVRSWAEGESELGLNNSLFICEQGNLTQYVDSEEGESFNVMIEQLSENDLMIYVMSSCRPLKIKTWLRCTKD